MAEFDKTDIDVANLLDLGGDLRGLPGAVASMGEKIVAGAIYAGTAVCIGVFATSHMGSGPAHSGASAPSAPTAAAGPISAYAFLQPAASPSRKTAGHVMALATASPALRDARSLQAKPKAYAALTTHDRHEARIARERRLSDSDLVHHDNAHARSQASRAYAYVTPPRAYAYVSPPARKTDFRLARAERLEALDAIWLLRQK